VEDYLLLKLDAEERGLQEPVRAGTRELLCDIKRMSEEEGLDVKDLANFHLVGQASARFADARKQGGSLSGSARCPLRKAWLPC
jgi:2-hydroxychromene-2-carboxylate isomerase